MPSKDDLKWWIVDALKAYGGKAFIIDVAEHIWTNHSKELETNRNLFFRWQYVMRWAALELRKDKIMTNNKPQDPWELTEKGWEAKRL